MLFHDFDVDAPVPELPGVSVVGAIGYTAYLVLFFFSIPLMQAALAKAVAEVYLGGRIMLGSVYRFALRCWPTLVTVTILNGMIVSAVVLLGALLPVAGIVLAGGLSTGDWLTPPGLHEIVAGVIGLVVGLQLSVVITVKLFFGPLVVVLEEEGAFSALRRSWELTGGHFWRILVVLGILWLFVTVLTGIIVWPAQFAAIFAEQLPVSVAQAVLHGLSAFAQLFIQPIQIIGTVLLYYDLRMRKEGFDLVMMAEAIGEPHLAERAPTGEARPALYGPAIKTEADGAIDEPTNPDNLPRT